ncbi:hypothetical protein [Isoptericola croceus]|uniref:hypothetical protein n=1 Tax=Isoptericola croceus TaxID=3031406 RepID=UPI0023F714D0|nr:hypothetical protein [Isoptericola croceus]
MAFRGPTAGTCEPEVDPAAVPGHLFTASGKWKYEVSLDYRHVTAPRYEVAAQAAQALAAATDARTSGVALREIPEGWSLVVFDAPAGFPVMVRGPHPVQP